ncbi:MAG: cytochrome o ubiquinol oxidase subunit IV [Candidatus Saccharimonadales bacterium]
MEESSRGKVIYSQHETEFGNLRMYVTGFVLSVLLTLVAFYLVYIHTHSNHGILSQPFLVAITVVLAIVQFVVQMVYFLHLGRESKPQWKRYVMFSMIVIVLIVVVGSLWIMHNLNYRMTPQQINNYMTAQDGGL